MASCNLERGGLGPHGVEELAHHGAEGWVGYFYGHLFVVVEQECDVVV